jgi:hypothetical protein
MYRPAAIIHALLLWESRNKYGSDVNTHHVETKQLLSVSVGHLLDWNSTFNALEFRASWITGKLFSNKGNVFIRMLKRRVTNMSDVTISTTTRVRQRQQHC